ncbi:MAG: putative bifunctional diguanylate cyclase/phosphodiesterase [Pseudonocardia sp.]
MNERWHGYGVDSRVDLAASPGGPRATADAVARAQLRRSREAVFGDGALPPPAMAVDGVPHPVRVGASHGDSLVPSTCTTLDGGGRTIVASLAGRHSPWPDESEGLRVLPAPPAPAFDPPRQEPAASRSEWAASGFAASAECPPITAGDSGGPEIVHLPSAPSLVCDRSDRIVRVNAALLRLAGRPAEGGDLATRSAGEAAIDDTGLFGMRLPQLVVGPDADARLVRADGALVRVRVVRWDLPARELHAVVLVELGEALPPDAGHVDDRRWIASLERMARVGTWSYELASTTLRRSETLQQLYRAVGLDPDGGVGPVEGEQVALLCQGLRSGAIETNDHHIELQLAGGRRLSCRAEVECADDGTPVRLVGVVRDVGAQRAAECRVRHSGQRFADLMSLVPGGVALVDASGRLIDANPALCGLLDMPLERLRGTRAAALTAESLVDPPGGAAGSTMLPAWLRAAAPGARYGYRIDAVPLLRGDGTTVWCELAVSVTTADDGGLFWMVVCTDIGERRRVAQLLRSADTVDELTRLPNRAASLELVDRLLADAGRHRVAVVCGGLDAFQRVNSSLGFEAGDDLLIRLAGRLQRELPVGCTAARLSGDEFVVICADHAEVGGPDLLARTVADLLRVTVTVHGGPVQITASVGLATPALDADVGAADLLRFAEVAMHEAKRRQGRGGIAVATDGVVGFATAALELEAELRTAITGDGLVLEYQPVVGPDGTVQSVEALVRWPHPERGLIPPGDFLPIAQRCGLLRELDLWVLGEATREAATWPAHLGRPPAVAVNLAGLLPSEVDFLSAVTEVVVASALPWDRLVLELVETSLVALPPHAVAAMTELVSRGVRFAVDDFGTGHSSLTRLKELPAQIVKLDRAFVTGVADDEVDAAVARAVVDMARAIGRSTVAEGVETVEQFQVLRKIGLDAYQGWLFARPQSAEHLRELLAADRLPSPPPGP